MIELEKSIQYYTPEKFTIMRYKVFRKFLRKLWNIETLKSALPIPATCWYQEGIYKHNLAKKKIKCIIHNIFQMKQKY